MKSNKLTIVELMVAIVISSVVLALILTSIMQVAYVTRDIITDYSLTNFGRLARFQILRGTNQVAGLHAGEEVSIDGDTLSYKVYNSSGYAWDKPDVKYGGDDYGTYSLSIKDQLNAWSSTAAETFLLPSMEINTNLTRKSKNGDDVTLFLRIERVYQGKKFSIEQPVKSVSYYAPVSTGSND